MDKYSEIKLNARLLKTVYQMSTKDGTAQSAYQGLLHPSETVRSRERPGEQECVTFCPCSPSSLRSASVGGAGAGGPSPRGAAAQRGNDGGRTVCLAARATRLEATGRGSKGKGTG